MLDWLRRLFTRRPRVWLVYDKFGSRTWHKVVSRGVPGDSWDFKIIGPLRSEVDAEEIADRMNAADIGRIRLYQPKVENHADRD